MAMSLIDSKGNIYAANSNGTFVTSYKPAGGYFISPALPAGLNFDTNTGIISGTPTGFSAATTYTVVAYTSYGSNSATISVKSKNLPVPPTLKYTTPQVYTAGTAIATLAPTSLRVAAANYGPAALIQTGFGQGVLHLATDGAGNLYVADYPNNQIDQIPAGGGSEFVLASGLANPNGIAVDAAGNIYEVDYGFNQINKIAAGTTTPVVIAKGLNGPSGIAVDAAGNLYVGSQNDTFITEIPADGSPFKQIGDGFSSPRGVAIDNNGNIFVADYGNQCVKKIPGDGSPMQLWGPAISGPSDVAVDGDGNVYVADAISGRVFSIPADDSYALVLNFSYLQPYGIAVDGKGNVFSSDLNTYGVQEDKPTGSYFISPFLPKGLSFNITTGAISGTPADSSAAKNYTVIDYNIGGTASATINIKVNLPPLPSFSYAGPQTYTAGTAIAPLSPAGGVVAAPVTAVNLR